MIQKLSLLLGLDHQALNLTEEVYNSIMLLPTFETSSVTTTTTVTVSTSELLTSATTASTIKSICPDKSKNYTTFFITIIVLLSVLLLLVSAFLFYLCRIKIIGFPCLPKPRNQNIKLFNFEG